MLPLAPGAKGQPPRPPIEESSWVTPAWTATSALAWPVPRVSWKCTPSGTPGQARRTSSSSRTTRAGVAWSAVGCSRGAYEHALRYANDRTQFGRPIASFQLVQDLLVRMLGNITASAAMCARLSHLQGAGEMTDEQASLAKAFCTMRMRETVGYAREILGGNGIVLDKGVARFFADAEALYSYEGTREMNTLIVGRKITGKAAFV